MERYGDYNDYEIDAPKSKNPVVIAIKILIALVCCSVVGVLVFRMIFFNYYPDKIKNIYFTDNLKAYYAETNGNIDAKTQSLRFPYDNADTANFICDNLIVIKGAGELQISVRFNNSALDAMQEKSSVEALDAADPELLSFRLVDNYGYVYDSLALKEYDSALMYHYYKLSFVGIEFENYGDGTYPEWIRLEVFIKGQIDTEKPFAMIPIYENNADHNTFEDYILNDKELPVD